MSNRTIWDLMPEDRARNERRRMAFRFSLRMLMVLFTLAAILMAIVGTPVAERRRETQIANELEAVGAHVTWGAHKPEGPVHRFLYSWGLKDQYLRITGVTLNSDRYADSDQVIESNISLEGLATLPYLQILSCSGCGLDDADMMNIANCARNLKAIDLRSNPNVTDVGFEKLSGRFDRPRLYVKNIGVTNGCLRRVLGTFGFTRDEVQDLIQERTSLEFSPWLVTQVRPGKLYAPQGRWCGALEVLPQNTVYLESSRNSGDLEFAFWGLEDERVWLHLSANAPGIKDDLQLTRFGEKLQMLAISANGKSIEEVLSLLGELPHLETLLIANAESVGDLSGLNAIPSLRELGIFETPELNDTDLSCLAILKELRVLRIPHALVTSAGITDLRNELGSKFELLQLREAFREIEPVFLANDMADEISLSYGSKSNGPDTRWKDRATWEEQKERMDRDLQMAVFPRPEHSPMRPEDYMLKVYATLVERYARASTRSGNGKAAEDAISEFVERYSPPILVEHRLRRVVTQQRGAFE